MPDTPLTWYENFNPDQTEDFGELADAERIFKQLARYCVLRADAIRMRKNGMVAYAEQVEVELQAIYDRLPQSAKW